MPHSTSTTVALIQTHATNDPVDNLERTLVFIRKAAAQGAKLVCTQELFQTQYFCQTQNPTYFDLAHEIPGPTTAVLAELCAQLNIVLVASLFEKRMPGLYHNTAVIIESNGSLRGLYRKMHIPDDPGYFEKYYFTPGDQGFQICETSLGKIGVLLCWDQWFPEAARLATLQGAWILLYPTAIGWHDHERDSRGAAQLDAWQTIQRSHAIANGVFVGAANRIGREGQLTFWGNSFICDPSGQMLQAAGSDTEEILIQECHFSLIENTRREWPFLRDRRVDAYEDLLDRGPQFTA